MESRPKIQKLKQSKKAKTLVQEVSGAFREKCWGAADFGVLCHVVYCAAVITYNIQQKKTGQKPLERNRVEFRSFFVRNELKRRYVLFEKKKSAEESERKHD